MNSHLSILHLFGTTPDEKINSIADIRLGRLLKELKAQDITDYSIIGGFYDPVNTKQAIHKGHKAIVKSAKDKGLEMVHIMEDDCCFTAKGAWKYYLSQIPEDYDLFTALIYAGEVDIDNRIKNGMSGTHTLYTLHERFYDFVLNQEDNLHCDRNLGQYAFQFKYYVANPMCVFQRGGYSYNLKKEMWYDPYLEGKVLFGR